jgi:hypothetical protein
MRNIKSVRAQIWGFDLMIALTLFFAGLIVIYIYAINFTEDSESVLGDLYSESILVSSLILSEGNPENWTVDSVDIPGILNDNRINQTKLEQLDELVGDDYPRAKILVGATNNFYFNFSGMKIGGVSVDGIGEYPVDANNLIKTERVVIYENKPVKFFIYSWN